MRDSYTIVLLTEEDAPSLAKMEQQCFALAWTEEQYRTLLHGNKPAKNPCLAPQYEPALPPVSIFGVQNEKGDLLAYVSMNLCYPAQELEIYNIAVRTDLRRKGLAGTLLHTALMAAMRCGIESAFLEVRVTNVAALALYEKHGFTRCGVRKGYYVDTGEDALVMRYELQHLLHTQTT